MAVKNGTELASGDRFKLKGRWYTASADPWVPVIGGRPMPAAREVPVGPDPGDGYGPPTVLVFATDALPVGATTATAASVPGPGGWLTTEITFTRREWGGWHVRLAAGGRLLGWVVPGEIGDGKRGWHAYAASDAFRGDGPDDCGDPLDDVPRHLYGGATDATNNPAGEGRTRLQAAEAILERLHRGHAPALGYGPHPAVRRYAGYFCRGARRRWATAAGGPACPVCGQPPAALDTAAAKTPRPRRHGDGWAGTVPAHTAPKEQR